LAELLEDDENAPEAIEAIRSLMERLEIGQPKRHRGVCAVTLVGALASVLAFVAQHETGRDGVALTQKGRPFQDGSLGTYFVVAGAGFEPAAFRL
jgi:hypothetical protein